MTLAALWSRQGKLVLALAFLAATIGLLGILWAPRAQADIPAGTIVTITQDKGSTVDPGDETAGCDATHCVTYTVKITTIAPATGTTGPTVFELQPDRDLWPIAFANGTVAEGDGPTFNAPVDCKIDPNNIADNDIVCTSALPIDDDVIKIVFVALPQDGNDPALIKAPSQQPAPVCEVTDAGSGNAQCTESPNAAAFNMTINDYTITPKSAENGPGANHTVVFHLPVNFTCFSGLGPAGPKLINGTGDPGADPDVPGVRACDSTDVVLTPSGGATPSLVGSPTLVGTALSASGDLSVTINSPTAGNVDIALKLAYVTQFAGALQDTHVHSYEENRPLAHKTYGVVSSGGQGHIEHVDLPDAGTEDAAQTELDTAYCATIPTPTPNAASVQGTQTNTPSPSPVPTVNAVLGFNCGVLTPQDDIDDAAGSFHGACLLGTNLTFTTNDKDLTWHIDPIQGGPPAESVSTFGGPNGEPCVMWGAATPGTQSIFVVYHQGLPDQQTFFWDTNPNLELIKEWNSIDTTSIVAASGDIGSGDDTLKTNTGAFAQWTARNCSMIPAVPSSTDLGFCDNGNLDTLTLQQEGSIINNSFNNTLVKADGMGFIDYTMGQHSDAGGAYSGPVDGAQQEYTISGDCGSVRLENPTTGNVIILNNDSSDSIPDSATVLSSDKGVGFEILPNHDGDVGTDSFNADCGPNGTVCVTIETFNEANQFASTPKAVSITEEVCVEFVVGPPNQGKAPLLAWAGQRVVLEHYWGDPSTGVCDYNGSESFTNSHGGNPRFGVQYSKQGGPGGFTSALVGSAHDIDQTNDDVVVHVSILGADDNHDGVMDPESNCTSRALYEAEGPGEVDISAYVVDDDDNVGNSTPHSQQVPFVIYYMKFEDVTLGIVPGDYTAGPSATGADISNLENSSTDLAPTEAAPLSANVSANVLARVRVRGWVFTDNCPARASGVGENGEFLPANRCIFPDDWGFKAGGGIQPADKCISTQVLPDPNGHPACALNGDPDTNTIGEETFPKMDINKRPSANYTFQTNGCQTLDTGAEGPFSLLDGLMTQIINDQQQTSYAPSSLCDDTLAPYVADGGGFPDGLTTNCIESNTIVQPEGPNGFHYSCRETVFPDGVIDAWDAPMPPALIRFLLAGSGYLHGTDKAVVYPNNTNQFYDENIPAEPWIAPINSDLEGYQWNSYGAAGGKDGPYHFWNDFASHGPAVISCAGSGGGFVGDSNPCPNDADPLGVSTCDPAFHDFDHCGYKLTRVYSDNHGEAMTWINGDADLGFGDCDRSTPTANDHDIVLLHGIFCEPGDVVGSSTLTALADYPDKRKHFAEVAPQTLGIEWTWGGIKEVTVCQDVDATHSCETESPGLGSQFHYVVFHVTDRDGNCGAPDPFVHTQLHPVLFEEVQFHIDSDTGVIVPDVNGNEAEGPEENGDPAIVSEHGTVADTDTFDTSQEQSVENGGIVVEPVSASGECQAWIHVSESLLNPVNVIVTAFDPEGTVTFDTTGINPTATPTPVPTAVPTPTATPANKAELWADFNCDGKVDPVDALIALLVDANKPFTPPSGCPTPKTQMHIVQDGTSFEKMWGDADCNGDINPVDALKMLKFDAAQFYFQQEPCPDIGSEVLVPA